MFEKLIVIYIKYRIFNITYKKHTNHIKLDKSNLLVYGQNIKCKLITTKKSST